ncbi:MAG: hypothetical protein P8O16_10290 [Algoriphagus sp.]|jgi:hypothetical protein|uniref:hypothetical protein n=1 Tax=Algoriphagus sp. TaxID=1872435 RepID=UPI002635DFF9|nr:hypothetical protein [Algoriphagus sp.]MDG1277660.1 hypothetical protein [Algoriphagus sp.]
MNSLSPNSGEELFACHDQETIQHYLWEMQKGWVCYINQHAEGADLADRLYFFELLWNWISEQIPPTAIQSQEEDKK